MIAALFDAEGTLYTGQMARGLLDYANRRGRRRATATFYAMLAPFYSLRTIGLVSDETARRTAIERIGMIVKGWTEEEGDEAFDWVIRQVLLPTTRIDVMERYEKHRAQGDMLVLVSGMPVPCLERLGDQLGANGVVGTQFELKDGRFTGRVLPPIMVGSTKGEHVRAFFASKGLDINWDGSYAYADSVHDRSLLEQVGHPVVVYPDLKLREIAYQRGWDAIGAPIVPSGPGSDAVRGRRERMVVPQASVRPGQQSHRACWARDGVSFPPGLWPRGGSAHRSARGRCASDSD